MSEFSCRDTTLRCFTKQPHAFRLLLGPDNGQEQNLAKLDVSFPTGTKNARLFAKGPRPAACRTLCCASTTNQLSPTDLSAKDFLCTKKNKPLLEGGFEPPTRPHKGPSSNLARALIVLKLRTNLVNNYCSQSTGERLRLGSGTGLKDSPRLDHQNSPTSNGKLTSDLN